LRGVVQAAPHAPPAIVTRAQAARAPSAWRGRSVFRCDAWQRRARHGVAPRTSAPDGANAAETSSVKP
jgi:hypothetical protein